MVKAVRDLGGGNIQESGFSVMNSGWPNYCQGSGNNCSLRYDPDNSQDIPCGDEISDLRIPRSLDSPAQGQSDVGPDFLAPYRIIGQASDLPSAPNAAVRFVYYHLDHLGSPRVITDAIGNKLSEHHYMPFGEELPVQAQLSTNKRQFTGHERDGETGMDYMLARYYSSSLARFMAVDPGDDTYLEDPQSWNKYTYVGNNPLNFVDDTGEGKIGFAIRGLKGIWRAATSKQAQSAYRAGKDVKVTGKGASRAAESLAKKAKGKNTPEGSRIVRHDGHQPGQDRHYQTQPGDGSHVRYDTSSTIIPGAGLGAVAGDAVEDATGSETAGDATQLIIDLLNPLSDIEDVIDLFSGDSESPVDSEEPEAPSENSCPVGPDNVESKTRAARERIREGLAGTRSVAED